MWKDAAPPGKANSNLNVIFLLNRHLRTTYMAMSTMARTDKIQVSVQNSGRKFIFGSSSTTAHCTRWKHESLTMQFFIDLWYELPQVCLRSNIWVLTVLIGPKALGQTFFIPWFTAAAALRAVPRNFVHRCRFYTHYWTIYNKTLWTTLLCQLWTWLLLPCSHSSLSISGSAFSSPLSKKTCLSLSLPYFTNLSGLTHHANIRTCNKLWSSSKSVFPPAKSQPTCSNKMSPEVFSGREKKQPTLNICSCWTSRADQTESWKLNTTAFLACYFLPSNICF